MATVKTVELAARLQLFEDGVQTYQLPFNMNGVTYTEFSAYKLVLATSSGMQEVSMGGVGTGVYVEVKSDRPILMSLNTTLVPVPIGRGTEGGVIAGISSFTHVYLNNASTTNQATVTVAITDENA